LSYPFAGASGLEGGWTQARSASEGDCSVIATVHHFPAGTGGQRFDDRHGAIGQLLEEGIAQEVDRAVREEEIPPARMKPAEAIAVVGRNGGTKSSRPHVLGGPISDGIIIKGEGGLPCRRPHVKSAALLWRPLADEEGIACPIRDVRDTNKRSHVPN